MSGLYCQSTAWVTLAVLGFSREYPISGTPVSEYPSTLVVGRRSSALSGSVALRKGPRRFCPHHTDSCRVLMLMCRKSPLWQHCERCNNVVFVLAAMARSIEQRGHHVTCALIGTSRKLAAYNYASGLALEQRLSTNW